MHPEILVTLKCYLVSLVQTACLDFCTDTFLDNYITTIKHPSWIQCRLYYNYTVIKIFNGCLQSITLLLNFFKQEIRENKK